MAKGKFCLGFNDRQHGDKCTMPRGLGFLTTNGFYLCKHGDDLQNNETAPTGAVMLKTQPPRTARGRIRKTNYYAAICGIVCINKNGSTFAEASRRYWSAHEINDCRRTAIRMLL